MDYGQHLRLLITESTTSRVIGASTNLTFHLGAATEDSTTKDTTDPSSGIVWNEYDVTQRSGDIQVEALVCSGTDTGAETLNNMMSYLGDLEIDWDLALVSGTQNRTISSRICSGKGKLSNIQISAANRQKATFSCTINIYGPVTVAA